MSYCQFSLTPQGIAAILYFYLLFDILRYHIIIQKGSENNIQLISKEHDRLQEKYCLYCKPFCTKIGTTHLIRDRNF